jgi:hypothetical protein
MAVVVGRIAQRRLGPRPASSRSASCGWAARSSRPPSSSGNASPRHTLSAPAPAPMPSAPSRCARSASPGSAGSLPGSPAPPAPSRAANFSDGAYRSISSMPANGAASRARCAPLGVQLMVRRTGARTPSDSACKVSACTRSLASVGSEVIRSDLLAQQRAPSSPRSGSWRSRAAAPPHPFAVARQAVLIAPLDLDQHAPGDARGPGLAGVAVVVQRRSSR